MSDLLPCPFCGKSAVKILVAGHNRATCNNVDCAAFDVIAPYAAWNARADGPTVTAYREALRDMGLKPDSIARAAQVNETPKSEHDAQDVLTPAALDTPAPALMAELVEVLREARDDLEAYVQNDWPETIRAQYPSVQNKWDRDMQLCRRIDALLAQVLDAAS